MADQIVHECVSEAEAAAGRLGAAKLARLVAGWKRDGLAVLANVIEDGPALDAIRERLDFDAAHRYANGDIFKGTGPAPPKATDPEYVAALAEGSEPLNLHLQLAPPRQAPFYPAEIYANPIIEQLAVALLGGDCYIRYINGNTACPGSTVQGLHVDSAGTSGTKLAVNFSTDDITIENGSTEVWPGTQGLSDTLLDEDGGPRALNAGPPLGRGDGQDQELVESARTSGKGPVQLLLPKGCVCLRDLRVWHRGRENNSALPRHMLYLSYNADPSRDPWANSSQLGAGAVPLQFSESCREALSAPASVRGVNRNVSFTPDACDHYGNVEGKLQRMAPSTEDPGARFTFWLPDTPIEDDAGLPKWVREIAAGKKLVRPVQGALPAWAVPAQDDADAARL
jgi:ectoine hydroxylase-related dioxygenase (phytanoyl-CoA dioxygenase family)